MEPSSLWKGSLYTGGRVSRAGEPPARGSHAARLFQIYGVFSRGGKKPFQPGGAGASVLRVHSRVAVARFCLPAATNASMDGCVTRAPFHGSRPDLSLGDTQSREFFVKM